MKILIFLLAFLLQNTLIHCQSAKTQKLGVMVHYTSGSGLKLITFIKRLTDTPCSAIAEINVIAPAQTSSQIQQIKKDIHSETNTAIPINFHLLKTTQNYRFRIPANSTADIYYISTIDLPTETCEEVTSALLLVQQKSVGSLLGLVGQKNSVSSFSADLIRKQPEVFIYSRQPSLHFAFVEDIRIIPRHFIQISQINIREIALMANSLNPICEELFINFVVNHFYPQLRPSYHSFSGTISKGLYRGSQDQQKSQCLRKFEGILGYVPVFYQKKEFSKKIWVNPNLEKVVQLKKQQLIAYLKNNSPSNPRTLNQLTSLKPQSQITTAKQQINFEQGIYGQIILKVLWSIVILLFALVLIVLFKIMCLSRKNRPIQTSDNDN